jgi:pimeloyl-ACP methyl ester carboxylesterase
MLAVVLMGLEALELLLAGWLATRWHGAGLAWPLAGAAVVALAFAWRALVVLATFPLGGSRWPGARAWVSEAIAFSGAYLAMTCAPLLARLDRAHGLTHSATADSTPTRGAVRLVLVHGWCCNGAVWRPVLRAWRLAGGAPPTVVTLAPVLGDIDDMARYLDRCVATECAGAGPLVVAAHSLGGLVARRWLQQRGAAGVAGLLTVGTPHAGTRLAHWGPGLAARQMRPGSDWLRRLEQPAAGDAGAVPVTCVWSQVDGFVSPAESARRPGGRSVEVGGAGHFGLLRSPLLVPALQQLVLAARQDASPSSTWAAPASVAAGTG